MAARGVGLIAALAGASVAVVRRRAARRGPKPAHAVIVSPRRSTVIARDGAVRSVQSAKLTLDTADLERLWSAPNLENLARTYWRFLSRATLGLIRVRYAADTRSVVLLGTPLTLLRFDKPEYVMESDHGAVRWRIRDGLLVARAGRGSGLLAVDVRRLPVHDELPPGRVQIKIEVEVANFYPAIAVGFSTPVYEMTQSVLHVLVTHAYLRSLADLDLEPSQVGVLAGPTRGSDQP